MVPRQDLYYLTSKGRLLNKVFLLKPVLYGRSGRFCYPSRLTTLLSALYIV